jgi:hypothetical protein
MEANEEGGLTQASPEGRKELLLRMYDQMFNDIDRHILVVWQSVGVLVGAFAIFALTEKQVITIDLASGLIVLLAGWLVAHLYDSAYWYNRNLVIIANIERQFLRESDLHEIHYYFGAHRPQNRMISHLRIQYALAVGLTSLVLLFHFITRVLPGMTSGTSFDPQRTIPYIVLVAAILYLVDSARTERRKYAEFLHNSPGIPIKTVGVQYGVGHGFRARDGITPPPQDQPKQ